MNTPNTPANELLQRFSEVKTIPVIAMRLNKLIADDRCTIRDLEQMIAMDPGLVVRILRMVNSAYYGLRRKVESVGSAVMLIGLNNLRNIVVVDAVRAVFIERPDSAFPRARLWLHSSAVSVGAKMISERVFSRIGDNAFLGGILHDIGMIVEDQVVNDLFLEVCRIYRPDERSFVECENELIGTNHCEVGYLLAQELNVPDEVAEGIRDHHAILGEMTSSNFSGIIQLADFLTAKLKFDVLPGMHPTLAPNIAVHLGANLDEYKAIGRDLPEEIAKAEELYRP